MSLILFIVVVIVVLILALILIDYLIGALGNVNARLALVLKALVILIAILVIVDRAGLFKL